jgi:hypothetical protein
MPLSENRSVWTRTSSTPGWARWTTPVRVHVVGAERVQPEVALDGPEQAVVVEALAVAASRRDHVAEQHRVDLVRAVVRLVVLLQRLPGHVVVRLVERDDDEGPRRERGARTGEAQDGEERPC